MHTLVIIERSSDMVDVRDPGTKLVLPPFIGNPGYRLDTWGEGFQEAAMVTGGSGGLLGAVALASASRTHRRMFEFAAQCLHEDRLVDVVKIQILFMFHRSHRRNVRAIVKAIRLLNNDARWRKLPDTYRRALRACRIVLMSCESGIEMNPADAMRYRSFANQFHDLRVASAVTFRLEQKPPPANPPQFWDPFIYTFTTGDFVHGGTRLHPNRVSFVSFTNTAVLGQGDDEHVDTIPGQTSTETPAAGKVHKYEGANYVGSLDVPAGAEYDAASDAF